MIENIKRFVNEHHTLIVVIIASLLIYFLYWWFCCKDRPLTNNRSEVQMLVDMLAEIVDPIVEKLDSLEKLVMSLQNNSQ